MARIHADEYGLYLKVNGSVMRPRDAVVAVLVAHDLDAVDYSTLLVHHQRVTRHSALHAGQSGVKASHIASTPLARVADEVWVSDALTPYDTSSRSLDSAQRALAFACALKRRRLGENIPNGPQFGAVVDHELACIRRGNKMASSESHPCQRSPA